MLLMMQRDSYVNRLELLTICSGSAAGQLHGAGQRERVITGARKRINRAETGHKTSEKCITIREVTMLLDTSHVEKKVRLSW